MSILNVGMISNPINWITLLVWVFILGMLLYMFDEILMGAYPQSGDTK
jgi:hypothetical protein